MREKNCLHSEIHTLEHIRRDQLIMTGNIIENAHHTRESSSD